MMKPLRLSAIDAVISMRSCSCWGIRSSWVADAYCSVPLVESLCLIGSSIFSIVLWFGYTITIGCFLRSAFFSIVLRIQIDSVSRSNDT
jgi:hypothetical protein